MHLYTSLFVFVALPMCAGPAYPVLIHTLSHSYTADSENIIFRRTLNPWNTMLTAGGSSGVEGALIALRGSPLGIGTDVAGSSQIYTFFVATH
jgi:hypothetical protein